MGNKGGANCELSEAKCGGKNRGGFTARGVPLLVSSIGRKLTAVAAEWLKEQMIPIDDSLINCIVPITIILE